MEVWFVEAGLDENTGENWSWNSGIASSLEKAYEVGEEIINEYLAADVHNHKEGDKIDFRIEVAYTRLDSFWGWEGFQTEKRTVTVLKAHD